VGALAYKNLMPGKFPKDYILHSQHGESLQTTSSLGVYKSVYVTGCVYDWNKSVTGRCRVDHNKRHEKRKSDYMLTSVSFFDDCVVPGLVF
jgi:hypothetical protein